MRLASDGREALDLVRAKAPDLVVCDLMMPDVDGFEVTRQLKSDARLKSIPILILTALKAAKERDRLMELGADGFAAKPFDSKELTAKIRELLGAEPLAQPVRVYNRPDHQRQYGEERDHPDHDRGDPKPQEEKLV